MKILCASDSSDDGYRGLEALARIIDRNMVDEIRILMITWPERESKIWERAGETWLVEDDLHQAMEVTVERELERFKSLLQDRAKHVVAMREAGEPSAKVLQEAASMNADLLVLAITSDPEAAGVRQTASRVIARSPVPVIIVQGVPEHRTPS